MKNVEENKMKNPWIRGYVLRFLY